jgi:hypothetical protein
MGPGNSPVHDFTKPRTEESCMTHFKRILACCIAVVAVGALSASTASATFTLTTTKCGVAGTISTLCDATSWEGTELFELSGTETAVAAGGVTALEVPSLGLTLGDLIVEGVGITFSQTSPLTVAYSMTGKLEYGSVRITQTPALAQECEVEDETITTTALLGREPNDGFLLIEPEKAGGNFADVTILNHGTEKCPATVLGENPVKGSVECELVLNTVDLGVHELVCRLGETELATPVRQLLKFGANQAFITNTLHYELTSKIPFASELG